MKFTGENTLPPPVDAGLGRPARPGGAGRTIPGCERLEAHRGERLRDDGHRRRRRDQGHLRRLLRALGPRAARVAGDAAPGRRGPGTIGADGRGVGSPRPATARTRVTYDADAVVGGMVGGVGQRMLTSVSRRMAGEFFGNVDARPRRRRAAGGRARRRRRRPRPRPAPVAGAVFTGARRRRPRSSQDDFLRGVAVGAGLVLARRPAGAVGDRRRR